jgi:hypothetical protein
MDLAATAEPARLAPAPGAVAGAPRTLLRLEGLAALTLAAAAYQRLDGAWWLFALLFLAPDLSMLGYLAGRRLGAVAYNAAHSYLGPALLGAAGVAAGAAMAEQLALIWAAHVGFDRALGYGLKYASAFGDTHLGRVGARRIAAG